MAGEYKLPLCVALMIVGAAMFVLSLTFLSPCGACWNFPWWVTFLRILGFGWIGAGAGGLIGVYRQRKGLPAWP